MNIYLHSELHLKFKDFQTCEVYIAISNNQEWMQKLQRLKSALSLKVLRADGSEFWPGKSSKEGISPRRKISEKKWECSSIISTGLWRNRINGHIKVCLLPHKTDLTDLRHIDSDIGRELGHLLQATAFSYRASFVENDE